MKIDIFGDNKSFVTNEPSSIKPEEANMSEENRIKYVTDLAAISRGKWESKNPKKRYESLLKEAAPFSKNLDIKTPSRSFEFLPIVINIVFKNNKIGFLKNLETNIPEETKIETLWDDVFYEMDIVEFSNKIQKFSYLKKVNKKVSTLYTNMRALLNAGIEYEKIPYSTEKDKAIYKQYKIVRVKSPMFVWAHLYTHQAFTKVSKSDRYTSELDYWLPNDLLLNLQEKPMISDLTLKFNNLVTGPINKVYNEGLEDKELEYALDDVVLNVLLNNFNQIELEQLFKDLGYPTQISSRAIYYFKYKEMNMGAWDVCEHTWMHLFLERNSSRDLYKNNGTQEETRMVVDAIKKVLNDNY